MGKSTKKVEYKKDEKEKQISILKQKYENRKAQVRRLQAYIRELEKKLEDAGNPVKESKMDKPKKVDPKEKAILQREELKKRMKERFGRKNE